MVCWQSLHKTKYTNIRKQLQIHAHSLFDFRVCRVWEEWEECQAWAVDSLGWVDLVECLVGWVEVPELGLEPEPHLLLLQELPNHQLQLMIWIENAKSAGRTGL